jgi:hypothetical protein
MTRDDIYDHLAQVYLGKRSNSEQKKKKKLTSWLVINIVITVVIFASSIYGLTAFLTHRGDVLQNKIIYALNNGPIRLNYNLQYPYPSVKTFSLTIPSMSVAKYKVLQFSVRALDEGTPGTIRVEIKNHKNEVAFVFVEHVNRSWRNYQIPFERFAQISDWADVSEISFVLEAWNAKDKKGIILIDDVAFSS